MKSWPGWSSILSKNNLSPACDICRSESGRFVFSKADRNGHRKFSLVKCSGCGVLRVAEIPSAEELAGYYGDQYFQWREERGYENYAGEQVRAEVLRVLELNLRDAGILEWEEKLKKQPGLNGKNQKPRVLEVGCAAGYFLDFFRARGWSVRGVELNAAMVRHAREKLGLPVDQADFHEWDPLAKSTGQERVDDEIAIPPFDLIMLWATLEHLRQPRQMLERIWEYLPPGGRFIFSTCRYGILARARGPAWRFMNVPEHLYFFGKGQLENLAGELGFRVVTSFSYGSGLTSRNGAGPIFRWTKGLLDKMVKKTHQGDMIVMVWEKIE